VRVFTASRAFGWLQR